MKYIKSGKYYYKINSKGIKTRISKDEYYKKKNHKKIIQV